MLPTEPGHRPVPSHVSLLGSTGSIGTQTLEIAALFPERIRIRALTAHRNEVLLAEQARRFKPDLAVIADESRFPALQLALQGTGIRIAAGVEGMLEAATWPASDTVVAAVVGFAGLRPTLEAVRAGKKVALANKETLVVAGALVGQMAAHSSAPVIPVDSEHSAIFQCLVGEPLEAVEKLILTASGGPFRTFHADRMESITRAQALDHPNWSMGDKITIDSATLMNKGLEVIEARWMFNLPVDRIQVVVHPQSVIHSMVLFVDGSTKAQLGVPDMKVPIQYALSWPDRWPAPHPRLDWTTLQRLDFEEPDRARFPCLGLAYEALRIGGSAPAVLNAANEQAVALFLSERIGFGDIARLIERVLAERSAPGSMDVEALHAADAEARIRVTELASSTVH